MINIVLKEHLQLQELIIRLEAFSIVRKGIVDEKTKICEIEFNFEIEDCTRITWQTLTVIILASLSVLLFSTLAIMFSLYQQRDLNSTDLDHDDDLDTIDGYDRDQCGANNEHHDDETNRRRSSFDFNNSGHEDSSYNLRNTNMFIVPRRTSSYDSSNMSRYSNSDVVDLNETQL